MYNKNLDQMSAVFLVIYLYPLFDLLLYSISLFFGSYMYNDIKDFFGSLHYFMLGYGVGMILLVGYTEVEFYYLLSYFIFRNIFVNWIMRKWERVVCNPPCLPGWAIVYYVSYLINFLPLIGVGKLVVSLGFKSPLFAIASPMLYSVPNPLYPSSTYAASIINSTWSGNIFWLAALIIWLGITLSQKY